jgi:ABC-type branched-subunit amino acid transport system ATPase component/branched-subunit amino acid ABC-type transport system permease component
VNNLLPFIIIGLSAGSVYGLAGSGLVLTYKTSGIFNFGYGAIATIGAYVFYWLNFDLKWSWPMAAATSVLLLGGTAGVLFELLTRRLASAPTSMKIVATVGIVLVVEGLAMIWRGPNATEFPQYLPQQTVTIDGIVIGYDQIIIAAISLASAVGLYAFLRFTRIGIATRAVVDDPDLLDLIGIRPARVRRISSVIGCIFASLAGVLLAPSVGLDATVLTLLVVQAFAAAAIGVFSSIPLTYLGGLFVGICTAVATEFFTSTSWTSGLPSALPFIVLFIALIVTRKGRLVERGQLVTLVRRQVPVQSPPSIRATGIVAILVVALLVPSFAGFQLLSYTTALTYVMLFLALGLLVKTAGMVSLCTATFAAIGATAFSHLGGLPWLLALILAAAIAIPVGAFIAIPAIRLSGTFLALATFGFAVTVQQLLYSSPWMFTEGIGVYARRPGLSWLRTDTEFYYVCLLAVVVTALAIMQLTRTRLGRLLRGISDSPTGLLTSGANVNVTRVLVFSISAFFTAAAGAFLGATITTVSYQSFQAFNSLTLLALLAIAVGGLPWYAVVAGVSIAIIPAYINGVQVNNVLNVVFGVFAILLAINGPPGLPTPLQRIFSHAAERRARQQMDATEIPTVHTLASVDEPASGLGLEINELVVTFGGVTAINSMSLKAPVGRITGLIGPNGAGKTTTFSACSGLVRPASGSLLLDGRDISRAAPSTRAGRGLGRTFQRMQLFDSLTVEENVALGREAGMAGRNPLSHLLTSPGQNETIHRATSASMELCGIGDIRHRTVGQLSTGQRRLVDLARCVAGSYDILLLDEPSSGLDHVETQEFGQVLLQVVRERGVGVLLVEHDMTLVMSVCEYLYVMDFGVLIFEGTPAEATSSPIVRAAYLGAELDLPQPDDDAVVTAHG